jgi:PPOX class probable F420-dependent enzyme
MTAPRVDAQILYFRPGGLTGRSARHDTGAMSRRDQIQMTDAELRDFLAKSQTIIITSINRDGMPHPMPMWYGVEPDGSIVMTTFTKSQKIRNIERDPRVTLLVEDGTVYNELRGVVIYGKADLIRDTDQVVEILARVSTKALDDPSDDTRDNIRKAVRGTAPKRTGIRVHPDKIVSWDHRKLGGVY